MSILLRQAEINLSSAQGLRSAQEGVFFPVAVVSLAGHGGRYITKASVGENPLWNETFVWRIDNRSFESNMQILIEIFQTTSLEAHVGSSFIELQSLLNDSPMKTYSVMLYGKPQGVIHLSARISPPFKPENVPQMQDPSKAPPQLSPSPPPPLVPSPPRPTSSPNILPTQSVSPSVPFAPSPSESAAFTNYRTNEQFSSPVPYPSKSSQQSTWKTQNLNQMLNQKTSSLVGIVSPYDPSVQRNSSNQSETIHQNNGNGTSIENKLYKEASSNSNNSSSAGGGSRDSREERHKPTDDVATSKLNQSPPNVIENSNRTSFSIPKHRNVFGHRSSDPVDHDPVSEVKSDTKPASFARTSQNPVSQVRRNEPNRKTSESFPSPPQRSFKSPSPAPHYMNARSGGSKEKPAGLPTRSPQRSISAPSQQTSHVDRVQGYRNENENGYGNVNVNDHLSDDDRFASQQYYRSMNSPYHVSPSASANSRHGSGEENGSSLPDDNNGSKHSPQRFHPSPAHSVSSSRKDADAARSRPEASMESFPSSSSSRKGSDSPASPAMKSFKQVPTHIPSLQQQHMHKQDMKHMRKSISDPTQSIYHGGRMSNSSKTLSEESLPSLLQNESKVNQNPVPDAALSKTDHMQYRYGESAKHQTKPDASEGYVSDRSFPTHPSDASHNPPNAYPSPHLPQSYPPQSYPPPSPSNHPYPAQPYLHPSQSFPNYPPQTYPPPGQQYPAQPYPPPAQPYPYQGYPPQPYPPHPSHSYTPPSAHGYMPHGHSPSPSHGLVHGGDGHGHGHNYGHGQGHSQGHGFSNHASSKDYGKGKGKGKGRRSSGGMGEMGGMAGGLAAGALAGAVGGLVLAEAIDGNLISDAVNGVGNAFDAVGDGIGNAYDTVAGGVDDAFDATADAFDATADAFDASADAFDVW